LSARREPDAAIMPFALSTYRYNMLSTCVAEALSTTLGSSNTCSQKIFPVVS